MPEAPSKVVVAPQGSVDVARPETQPVAVQPTIDLDKLSVAEYEKKMKADARGETYVPPADAVVTPKPAVATEDEKAAAAAAEKAEADKVAAEAKAKAEADAAAKAAEDEGEDPSVLEDAHPKKQGIARKFSKLTEARKKAEAEAQAKTAEAEQAKREAAEAKAETERLKAEAEARAAAVPVVPAVADDPAPKRDAFDDPDEYDAAVAAHAARGEIRKANERAEAEARTRREAEEKTRREDQQKKVQEQITTLHKAFGERVEAAKPEYQDYDVKVTNNEKLILRNDIFFTIERSELAPHILYHLSDHPEEAAALNGMSPVDATLRLGELQAEIRIARRPKASAAKPPVNPVRHRSSPEVKTADELSVAEYEQRMREQGVIPSQSAASPRRAVH